MCTEPITRFRYRLVDDETKPELPLREASGSLSIDPNLDHEPRELPSSAYLHDETSLPSPRQKPTTTPTSNHAHPNAQRPNGKGAVMVEN